MLKFPLFTTAHRLAVLLSRRPNRRLRCVSLGRLHIVWEQGDAYDWQS